MLNLAVVLGFYFSFLLSGAHALESDVNSACDKIGAEAVDLYYRDRALNIKNISSRLAGHSKISNYLKSLYSNPVKSDESKLLLAANIGNRNLIPDSEFKENALKYSSRFQKISNPSGYLKALLEAFKDSSPEEYGQIESFLHIKNPNITKTEIRPALKNEMDEVYGAAARLSPVENSKFKMEIIISNETSESIPYLIPLLAHELVHARSFEKRIDLWGRPQEYSEFSLIDEAIANDLEIRTYVSLARKRPEVFCNWLYVSWTYGSIVVPLSWVMAAKERELREGRLLYWYATHGDFKKNKSLLSTDGLHLRKDIQKRIVELRLKYVK